MASSATSCESERKAKETPENEDLQNTPREKESRLSVHDRAIIDFYRNAPNDGPTLEEELAGLEEHKPNLKKENSESPASAEEKNQWMAVETGISEDDLWDVLTGNCVNKK